MLKAVSRPGGSVTRDPHSAVYRQAFIGQLELF